MMPIDIVKQLKIKRSRPASHGEKVAKPRSRTTKRATASATRSRTALPASRTGGASQPAMTVTQTAIMTAAPPAVKVRSTHQKARFSCVRITENSVMAAHPAFRHEPRLNIDSRSATQTIPPLLRKTKFLLGFRSTV